MAKSTFSRMLHSLVRAKPKTIHNRKARLRPELVELESRLAPASFIWDGSSSGLWSDPQNWNNNPGNTNAPGNGDDVVFPAGAQNLANTNDIDGLQINSIAISGTGYVLGSSPDVSPITLGNPNLAGTGYINVNGAGIIDAITFDIVMGGPSGQKQFFTVNSNTSVLTISGKVAGPADVELSKDGTGTLVLSGDNSNFLGPISITEGALRAKNATALGDTTNGTTVLYDTNTGKFGQLQVDSVGAANPIAEHLFLNGTGPLNDGALLNVSGNNVWTGPIELDSNSTMGSNADSLTIQGVISDLGAGHNLTKEGPAKIILDPLGTASGNTYRGQTFVNNGTLTIRHSLALGDDPTPVQGVNDTVVQSSTNRSGTLQLEFVPNPARIDPNATATGFTVPTESLTLNGPGLEGIHILPKEHIIMGGGTVSGALNNLAGDNTWIQNISLWSGDSSILFNDRVWDWATVGFGAEANTNLTIAGHINDSLITGTATLPTVAYSLIKTHAGRVIFQNADTYRGRTEVLEGYLNIRDSAALGSGGSAGNGTIVFPQGTLELEADQIPDTASPYAPAPDGTPHLNTDIVITGTGENLSLMGTGAGGNGALRNIRGTNEDTGNIPLMTFIGRGTTPVPPAPPRPVVVRVPAVPLYYAVTFTDTGASVGVQPDQAPFNQFDLSQLTLSGIVSNGNPGTSSNLTKVGTGELVLTDSANTYTGSTFILNGWITIRNNRSLGADLTTLPDTQQPATFVAEGAALNLKQTRSLTPQPLIVPERIFLSGDGFSHRYAELNHRGALENLSGLNFFTGIVNLVATSNFPKVGLGADIANSPWVPADQSVTQSEVSLNNLMQETISNQANTMIGIAPPATLIPAGINKLGRKRVNLQGMGTFTGDNQVTEGALRVQSDTALGMLTGTTTVLDGAAIETKGYALGTGSGGTGPQPLTQFAESVIAFGSEWNLGGPIGPTSWNASQALGPPDTSGYGDIPTAWSALETDGPPNPDFLTLGYGTPVFATSVDVRETNDNGFVTQIDLIDDQGISHTVFTGPDSTAQGSAGDLVVSFPQTPYKVVAVHIVTDPNHVLGDWEEIDSVQLDGIVIATIGGTDNTINGGLPGGIQVRENLILNGLGSLTADDPSHNYSNPNFRVDTLTSVSDDNMWRSPITFATNVTIDSKTDSRLSLWKTIDGAGGFDKDGFGKLILGGVNSYSGTTTVNRGTLNLQSSSALGAGSLSEVQNVTVTGSAGTFKLTFNGQTTGDLAFDVPASGGVGPTASVQNALNALSSISNVSGSVTVIKTGNVYSITFQGSFSGSDVPEMTATGSGGATVAVVTVQPGGVGGTIVKNDAQIELQGDVTIAGENLQIQGNGPDVAPNIPLRWYAEGPGPITDNNWTGNSDTGRVTGVAVDPNDTNVLYLSAAGGGAWRSLNNGLTWQQLIDNVNGLSVDQALFTGAIAVAPTNSNIIYVGLGESNNSGDSYYGRGLLKSSDFGRTWTMIQPPGFAFDRHTISKIVVDPVEPNTIYVTLQGDGVNATAPANFGVWMFRNGAWTNLIAGVTLSTVTFDGFSLAYTDLQVFNANPRITINNAQHPNQPLRRIISFSLGDYTGGGTGSQVNAVYTTTNATLGTAPTSWTWSANNFPVGLETVAGVPNQPRNGMIKIGGVRNNASRDTIVQYASITYPVNLPRFNSGQAGIFREVQTETITYDVNTGLWNAGGWGALGAQPGADVQGQFPGQGWYDSTIAVQSQLVSTPAGPSILGNPGFVFIGGTGHYTAASGPFVYNGSAWISVDPGATGNGPHVDYHASFFDRNGRLVVGNDGGIWRLENTTAPAANGANWTNLNNNGSATSFLQITEFNGLDVDPFNPFFAVGGSQDNSTEIYNDSSTWTAVEGGDGGIVRINNKNPQIMFHVLNGTLRRSTSGGVAGSWSDVYQNVNNGLYFPFILDRVNPSRVILGDGTDLWESMADGAQGTFNIIGAATSNPDGLGFITAIAVSDRQGTWVNDTGFPLVLDNGADSYDSDTIYVAADDGVHVTKNHGQAWVTRNTGLTTDSLSDITVDPRNRDTAYVTRNVFGGGHVFRTTDAGQTWTDISGNLPNLPTWKVVVNPRNGDVYIGNDNGVYVLPGGTGATWSRFGTGMPNAQVKELVLNTYTNMLSAGMYGRGLYQIWLDDSRADSGAVRAVTGSSLWTGNVSITGTATDTIDFRAEVGAQINFSGVIADAVTGVTHTINKVGPGRVIFAGANTYGGLTDIKEGELNARNSSALGDPNVKTIVEAGAALEMQADLFRETVELNGDGIQINGHNTGALRNVSNNNTFTGTLKLMTNSTIGVDSGSTLTIGVKTNDPTGVVNGMGTIVEVGGARRLRKELSGTLILNSANSYTGQTDVIQGVLQVAHAGALGGTANGTQVRNGAQLELNKDVNGNPITVVGEQLILSGTGIFGTGALENVSGNNTWQGGVTLTAIQGIAAPPPPVPPSTISIGVLNAADILTIDGAINEQAVTIPAQPPLIPSPVTLNTFGLTKVLPGKLVLKGNTNNTYTGVTTVQTGVLNIQKAQALGTPGGPGSSPTNGTVVNSGAALETEGNIVFAAETVTLNGLGVSPANAGALRNTGGANTWTGPVILNSTSITVNQPINIGADAGTQLTITGKVQDPASVPAPNKPAALHKVGTGTIVLNDTIANTYQGRTFVDQGVLNIRKDTSLGAAGSATNDTTVATGATLQVQGGMTETNELLTINGLGFNGQGALANNIGVNNWNSTITLGSNASLGANTANPDKLTVNGQITDGTSTFSVTKVGPGTVEYASATPNDYQGLTQVNEGTLLLNKAGGALPFGGNLTIGDNTAATGTVLTATNDQVPDGAVTTVNSDGVLDINGHAETINTLNILDGTAQTEAGALTVGTSLSMTGGDINLGGAGNRLLFGTNATINATSSAAETALIHGSGGSVSLTGASPRTFNVSDGPQNIDLNITSPIADSAANERLVKDGAGVMDISSNVNTYDGVTEAHAGLLLVDGTIPGSVALNGGTLGGNGHTGDVNSLPAGGTVNPGDSPGILHTGTVNWNAATTFFVELNRLQPVGNSLVAGTDYDQLQVTGDLNLGNAHLSGAVDNIAGNPQTIALGDSFTIATYTGSRNSSQFAEGNTVFIAGRKFTITYDDANKQIILTKVKANVTVAITANPSNTTVYGQPVTFTITVTPETPLTTSDLPASDTVTITFTTVDQNNVPHVYSSTQTLTNGQYTLDPHALFGAILGVGTHTVQADFHDPTFNFNDVNGTTATQTVNKGNSTIALSSSSPTAVYGAPVTITATLGIAAPAGQVVGTNVLTGTVTFTFDGTPQTPSNVQFVGTQFVATFDLPGSPNFPAVGDHIISAVYSGDSHYNGIGTTTDFVEHIIKANSAVTVSGTPNPADVGQQVDFLVSVNSISPSLGIPTGTVSIADGATTFDSGTIDSNGQIHFLISTLSFGQHTINVSYLGDTNFNTSTGSTTETIKGLTTTTVTSSVNPSTYGQQVTFTINVAPVAPASGFPTGTVDVLDNGAAIPGGTGLTLTNGATTFQISTLSAGSHPITVHYNGDTVLSASTGTLSPSPNQVVNKANTTTALTASPASPTIYGQQITFTATVTAVAPGGNPVVGTVDFLDGVNVLAAAVPLNASGVATLQYSTLTVGTHNNITAHYNGTTNYNVSTSGALSRTVNKASTTITLAANPNPSAYGVAAVTATVAPQFSGVPTGSVVFQVTNLGNSTTTNINATLTGGVATLPPQVVGNYSVTVSYAGDTNFNGSNGGPTAYNVTPNQTTVTIASTANPGAYGIPVITATVTPNVASVIVPSGPVSFAVTDSLLNTTNYQVNLVNGVATLPPPPLNAGTYTITATFAGDGNFLGDSDGPFTQVINKSTTSVGVASSANPSVIGQAVTFTATVSAVSGAGIPDGSVTFIIDSNSVGTVNLNASGAATFMTSTLTIAGSPHSVSVNYNGNSINFLASSGSLVGGQTVTKGSVTGTIVTSNTPEHLSTQVTFTGTFTPSGASTGTPGGTADLFIDGSDVSGSQPVNNGVVSYAISTLLQGSHSVFFVYNGDANFNGGVNTNTITQVIKGDTTTIVVSDHPAGSIFGEPVTFTATVARVLPAVGTPAGSVTFVDTTTGANLGTANLNGSGVATLTVNNIPVTGSDAIQATYNPASESAGNYFFTSNGATTQTVTQGTTTTSLGQSSATTGFGQTVTFTATVTPNAPSTLPPAGSVTFVDVTTNTTLGTAALNGSGQASLPFDTLSFGSHNIQATYVTDGNYAASTSSQITHNVIAVDTTTTVGSSLNPSFVGQTVTFTATVTGNSSSAIPTGTVQFFIDNVAFGIPVNVDNTGHAAVSTSGLSQGPHNITATYTTNSANFNNSTSSALNQTVNPNPILFAVLPSSVKSGAPFTVVVFFMNANGVGINTSFNGAITLSLNNNPGGGTLSGLLTVNASNGIATFSGLSINRAADAYNLKATASGLPPAISGNINVTAVALLASVTPRFPLINQLFRITAVGVDVTGNRAANYNGTFFLQILRKPAGAVVKGSRVGQFAGGGGQLALRVSKAGTYTVRLIGPNGLVKQFNIIVKGRRAS